MTAHTQTIYLIGTVGHGGGKYIFLDNSDFDGSGEYVVLGQQEVTIEIPPTEILNGKLIASLEEKKVQMQATATAAINEVEGQIQSLLALENQGEEA